MAISVGILCWQLARLADPTVTPPDDFLAYWAAGRINASGGNPYDPAQLLPLQRTANWTKDAAYRIWYPPWALPLLMPFAVLPYAVGRLLWFALSSAALILSADWLWRYYGGDVRHRGLAWIIGATFAPATLGWRTGQVGALMLLGLVGFLCFERERRWVAAGASLALIAIKPQLLYLFWIALLLWVVDERHWRILLGAAVAGLVLLAAALAPNPAVLHEFIQTTIADQPYQPVSTLGTVFRMLSIGLSGRDRYWLQFLPSAVGVAWLVLYWRSRRRTWQWERQMPAILLASLATASWVWVYDEVVLLVAVMQIAVSLRSGQPLSVGLVGMYVAINAAAFAMNLAAVDPFWYVWTPFAFLIWYSKASAATGGSHPAPALSSAG